MLMMEVKSINELKKYDSRISYLGLSRNFGKEIALTSGLLSRRAVEAVKKIKEQHRFMKGLFAWIGFPQKSIDFKMDERFAGKSKWSYFKLWNFAIEGITSFTIMPLKLANYLGLLTVFIAFIYGIIIFTKTLLFGDSARGYPSLMVVILFLGSIQLFTLGIIGEYLGRTFNETKNRPLYFIKNYFPNDFDV
ncbi:MAG: hypothetical protein RJA83_78 [Pseudomonadota bacterium]|jgi:glycosyltransferase involved in cell wall biosynthesis